MIMTRPQPPVFAPRGRIVRAADVTAWHEGDGFLAAARAEAERIVAAAQNERDRLIAQGRAEGERAGEVAITRRVAEATRRLDHLLEHSEDWLAALVADTVERILGDMDRRDATVAAAITALRAFRHGRRLVVRVSPTAVEWIESGLKQGLETALLTLVVIQPDPLLNEGRCVVASEFGIVEAGIAEQLAALRAGLQAQSGPKDASHE